MHALSRLVSSYVALARVVAPERSRTAALIRSGDAARALARLPAEIAELVAAFDGGHAHPDAKSAPARRLLESRGLDAARADLLLEASQVSYWWLVARLAGGGAVEAASIAAALAAGAAARGPAIRELAAAAAADPTVESVYGLIGAALAACSLPLDLFAELDLEEMAGRPYLQEALGGA